VNAVLRQNQEHRFSREKADPFVGMCGVGFDKDRSAKLSRRAGRLSIAFRSRSRRMDDGASRPPSNCLRRTPSRGPGRIKVVVANQNHRCRPRPIQLILGERLHSACTNQGEAAAPDLSHQFGHPRLPDLISERSGCGDIGGSAALKEKRPRLAGAVRGAALMAVHCSASRDRSASTTSGDLRSVLLGVVAKMPDSPALSAKRPRSAGLSKKSTTVAPWSPPDYSELESNIEIR
jgi:hypothetical protein